MVLNDRRCLKGRLFEERCDAVPLESQFQWKAWRLIKPARPSSLVKKGLTLLLVASSLLTVCVYTPKLVKVRQHTQTSTHSTACGCFDGSCDVTVLNSTPVYVTWQPLRSKIQTIYRYLDLTEEEAAKNLPLTLANNYSLNNPHVCGSRLHGDVVDVLFLVHTAPMHFRLRMRLRDTVFKHMYYRPVKVRAVFLLGQVSDPRLQKALEYEHQKYGDTVQGFFYDSYHNLTHKGVMGLNWVAHYCPRARVVFKMDDDVFVDTFQLLHHVLPMLDGKRRTILCNLWFNDTIRIMREDKNPWKVDDRLFYGLERYPFDYCSGMAVIITGDLIPSLFRASFFTPYFASDDVYLFGMLPSVAGDVTFYDVGLERNMTMNASLALDCKVRKGHYCPVLATTAEEYPNKFEELWNVTFRLHVNPGWQLPFAHVE